MSHRRVRDIPPAIRNRGNQVRFRINVCAAVFRDVVTVSQDGTMVTVNCFTGAAWRRADCDIIMKEHTGWKRDMQEGGLCMWGRLHGLFGR